MVWREAGDRLEKIRTLQFDQAGRERILRSVSTQVLREITTADAVRACLAWSTWPEWMPCGSREKFVKRVTREAEALLCNACELYREAK